MTNVELALNELERALKTLEEVAMLTLGAKLKLYECSLNEGSQIVVHPARGYTMVDICENCENCKTYAVIRGEITEV